MLNWRAHTDSMPRSSSGIGLEAMKARFEELQEGQVFHSWDRLKLAIQDWSIVAKFSFECIERIERPLISSVLKRQNAVGS